MSLQAPPPNAIGYSSSQVCRLTGLTYRQLGYWTSTDLVYPSIANPRGSGTRRRWSTDDVRLLTILRRALDAGVSLQRLRAAMPVIRDPEGCRWLVLGPEAVVCSAGVLEELVAEAGVSTVVDLEREVMPSLP